MMLPSTEEDTSVSVFFDVEVPCDGWAHPLARVGHVPEESASFALLSGCCGFRVMICAGRARFIREESGLMHCNSCGRDSSSLKWACVPL